MDLFDPFPCYLHHIAFDRLKSHTQFPCPASMDGTGRDSVPGYPSPYDLRVPVTIEFWACPQLENIHLNENNK